MPRSHAHRELEVHEPNSSSPLVITSSRVHGVSGTLFHRSWTRDHDFTSSMECSINTEASTDRSHGNDQPAWCFLDTKPDSQEKKHWSIYTSTSTILSPYSLVLYMKHSGCETHWLDRFQFLLAQTDWFARSHAPCQRALKNTLCLLTQMLLYYEGPCDVWFRVIINVNFC